MPLGRLVLTLGLLACGGCADRSGCALFEGTSPFVRVVYPEPSASDVASATGLVLYYSSSPVPLKLMSASEWLTGTPIVVPSPLPSPIVRASPAPGTLFAAAFASLSPETSYDVRFDQTTFGGCMPTTTQRRTASSFSTR